MPTVDFDTAYNRGDRFVADFADGETQFGWGLYSKSKKTLHFWVDDTDCTKFTRTSKYSSWWHCVDTSDYKVRVKPFSKQDAIKRALDSESGRKALANALCDAIRPYAIRPLMPKKGSLRDFLLS